jgi:hypothetical protein
LWCHDIVEILLKLELNTNQSINLFCGLNQSTQKKIAILLQVTDKHGHKLSKKRITTLSVIGTNHVNCNTTIFDCIIKRKFKQWWLTISPISTKRTNTSHLKQLNTHKRLQQALAWHRHKKVAGLNQSNRLPLYTYVYGLLRNKERKKKIAGSPMTYHWIKGSQANCIFRFSFVMLYKRKNVAFLSWI